MSYSTKDFADKIELLSTNAELRSSFGIVGKRNAMEKFSLGHIVTNHETLYLELINQSKF